MTTFNEFKKGYSTVKGIYTEKELRTEYNRLVKIEDDENQTRESAKDEKRNFIINALSIIDIEAFTSCFSNKKKAERCAKGECGFNDIERNEIEYQISIK